MSFCVCEQILFALLLLTFTAAHPSSESGWSHFIQPLLNSPALKTVSKLGVVFGAIETEAAIETHLQRLIRELDKCPEGQQKNNVVSETLNRSEIALEILGAGLELIASRRSNASPGDFKRALVTHKKELLTMNPKTQNGVGSTSVNCTSETSVHVKRQIEQQLTKMRRQLALHLKRAVSTLGDSNSLQATSLIKMLGKQSYSSIQYLLERLPKPVRFDELVAAGLKRHANMLLTQQLDEEGLEWKQNTIYVDSTPSNESESIESSEEEEGPGGLIGLIASLSGSDEGSDVGALIGTLSATITNLFGPGGLDVPGLLGAGTSLIAGLLGGDDNFGKVLGSYVGIAIEGLSGGGADMNGAFFGNFLGAVIAALSSDPEDDNFPLRPELFIENFFSGLEEAKRKSDSNMDAMQHKGGSDLFAFIGNIVSSVISGITSLVLNASLGSVSGTSQGTVAASGASSEGSSGSSSDHSHSGM